MKITGLKLEELIKPELREQIIRTAKTWEQTYKQYKKMPKSKVDIMTLLERGERAGALTEKGMVVKQKLEKAKVWAKGKFPTILGVMIALTLGSIFFISTRRN